MTNELDPTDSAGPHRFESPESSQATSAPHQPAPTTVAKPIQTLDYASCGEGLLLVKGPPRPPVFSVPAVLAVLAIVGLGYICAGSSTFAAMADESTEAQGQSMQVTVAVSQWLIFLLLPLLLVRMAGKDLRMIYSWHSPRMDLTILTVAMAMCLVGAVQYAGNLATMFLAEPYDKLLDGLWPSTAERMAETSKLFEADTLGGLMMGIFLAAVTPAVCEEHFFRGILQSSLDKHIPAVVAVIVSATIFAAFHIEPVGFAALLLVGLFVGGLTSRAGCILYAVIIHLVNNTYGILVHVWSARHVADEILVQNVGSFDSLPVYVVGGAAGLLAFLVRMPRRHRRRWHRRPAADDPAVFRPGRWRRGSVWLARRWRLAAVFALVCSFTGLSLDVRDLKEIAAANPKTHVDEGDEDQPEPFERRRFEDDSIEPPIEEFRRSEPIHVDAGSTFDQGSTVISAMVQSGPGLPGPSVIARLPGPS